MAKVSSLVNFNKQHEKYYCDVHLPNRQGLFIHDESGNATFNVTLSKRLPIPRLMLRSYVISGVPTTAGIPNVDYYNLAIEGAPKYQIEGFVRGDGIGDAIPLPITGAYTAVQVSGDGYLVSEQLGELASFRIHLRNPDMTDATLTSCAFWFELIWTGEPPITNGSLLETTHPV